jgi:hypothetical protein
MHSRNCGGPTPGIEPGSTGPQPIILPMDHVSHLVKKQMFKLLKSFQGAFSSLSKLKSVMFLMN